MDRARRISLLFAVVAGVLASRRPRVSGRVGAFPKTITATPTVDGTYTVVIDAQGTATGSMTLAIS